MGHGMGHGMGHSLELIGRVGDPLDLSKADRDRLRRKTTRVSSAIYQNPACLRGGGRTSSSRRSDGFGDDGIEQNITLGKGTTTSTLRQTV